VKPSPCHDEQVIYSFSHAKARQYRIDAYKLVAGQQLFMGSIDVTLDAAGTELNGPVLSGGQLRGRLHLTLKGSRLSGSMTVADGTLYRLIEVTKR
jgi:hypothetical protein